MVKILVLFFFVLNLYSKNLTCKNKNIKYFNNTIVFQAKDVILNYEIYKVVCLNGNLIILTKDYIYISTVDGELINKIPFFEKMKFLYKKDNFFYFLNDKNKIVVYKILPNGQYIKKSILTPINNDVEFISTNKNSEYVIFYKDYYKNKGVKYSYKKLLELEGKFYYLDINNKQVFLADKSYFQKKFDLLPKDKISNEFIVIFKKVDNELKRSFLNKITNKEAFLNIFNIYLDSEYFFKEDINYTTQVLIKLTDQKNKIDSLYLKAFKKLPIPNMERIIEITKKDNLEILDIYLNKCNNEKINLELVYNTLKNNVDKSNQFVFKKAFKLLTLFQMEEVLKILKKKDSLPLLGIYIDKFIKEKKRPNIELIYLVLKNNLENSNSQIFSKAFPYLHITHMQDILKNIDNRISLLPYYLKKAKKNKESMKFILEIADNKLKYYNVLKENNFLNIPNFGTYTSYDIDNLQNKLKAFTKSFDYKFFSKAGVFNYKINYPKSSDNYQVVIDYFLDDKKMFTIKSQANCTMISKTKEKGNRYKGFLIFTTVVYESMFEVKKYKCIFPDNDINKIKNTLAIIENSSNNVKVVHFKHQWNFSTKKWLYDISAKQTAFGKLLSEAFSGSSECYNIGSECKKNCKYKNSENGFFIFVSSDKSKCIDYCISAEMYCNRGDMKNMLKNICRAKCVGYNNDNGGFFSSSDYEKCMDRCLK